MLDELLEPIRRRASDAWRSFLGIPKLFRDWWYGEERRDFARVRDEEKEEILRARNLRGEIKEVAKAAAAGASGTGQREVFHAEGGQVTERRGESSHLDDLVGLAFSGGGIRSATFNLGVLQALANKKYLKQIDYLSTVSGGGYIGAWLAAWIKRKGCAEVEQKLSTNKDESPPHEPWRYIEPNPIRFLRKYSNYLAPRTGLASTDTWALLSVYCRNVLLNLTLLVAAGAAFLLVPLIIISADRHLQETGLSPSSFKVWGATVLLVMVAAWAIAYSFASFSRDVQPRFKSVLRKPGVFVLLPLVVAAICFTYLLARNQEGHLWKWLIAGAVSYSIIWIVGNTAAGVIEATSRHELRALFAGGGGPEPITTNYFWIFCWWVLANLIGGAFGGWLLFLARSVLHSFASPGALSTSSNIGARILLGPPFLLFSFVLVSILHVGLLGRSFPDAKREWLARLCGMIIMAAVVWVLVFGIAIYGPIIFKFLFASSWAKTIWGRVSQFLVASGWVGTTLAGVMGANRSNGKPNAVPRTGLFLKFAPIVFILGLALSLSAGLDALLSRGLQSEQSSTSPANENLYSFFEGTPSATKTPAAVSSTSALKALMETYNKHWVDAAKYIDWKLNRLSISFVALVLIVLLLAFRLDVNEFSIHLLYRNRLARCYLGASRGDDRQPQPFTGFDVDDDIPLARLTTQSSCSVPFERPYDGPYPIICTALNLVAGRDLAWQTRKATSFIYSPLYCGYDYFSTSRRRSRLGSNAYQPTQLFSSASGPFLGTAMAISGAAATPNMGYHSSPALTFLMAVFNVRLGWWAGNTRHSSTWKKPGPGTALYLAMELFGRTDEENRFVYLSDGGHFENLGLYELVRRKCRNIIVCDASCDPQMNFGDLGNAIEKCRRDLGAEITIDVSRLRPRKGERLSRAHYAYGEILYDDNSKGRLLYIKSSLTGAEREDVQAYAAEHPVFPHDSTAEQFFNETRFESYRALGQDAFDSVVEAIAPTVSATAAADSSIGPTPQPPSPTRTSLDSPPPIKDLFDELEKMHSNGLPPTRTGSLDLEELPFGKMKLTFRAL